MPISTEPKNSAGAEDQKDLMRIVIDWPPNFDLIASALPNAAKEFTYCYGDTIYNPSGKHIPIDQQFHEWVHMNQQEREGDPDLWWNKYLIDADFRLAQEMEAYCEQYQYAKEKILAADTMAAGEGKRLGGGKNNLLKWIRESMAMALSGEAYGSLISFARAESAIRNYGKTKEA
jgi:hypothetical protein